MSRSQPSSSGAWCAMNHSRSRSGMRRHRRALARAGLALAGIGIERRVARAEVVVGDRGTASPRIPGSGAAHQRLVDVDVLLERQRGVEHRFDALRAVLLDRRARSAARGWRRARRCARRPGPGCGGTAGCSREKSAWPSTCAVTSRFSARLLPAREVGAARGCRETRPRTARVAHPVLDELRRCSARRTTSAACAPAARRPRSPS